MTRKFTPAYERIRAAQHREASGEALAALMQHRTALSESDRQQAGRELLAAREVLALADSFHDLTPDEQAAAAVAAVIRDRAILAASPELQTWVQAGKH